MKSWALTFLFFLTSFQIALAQENQCRRPSFEACPNLYIDDCKSNLTFQEANVKQCVRVLAGNIETSEACSAYDPSLCVQADCSAEGLNPLQVFYCENAQPECPANIEVMQQEFDQVLTQLTGTLDPYNELIELDIGDIDTPGKLCAYPADEVLRLEILAKDDQDGIEEYRGQLGFLRQCNQLFNEFMEGPPPSKEIPVALWEQMKTNLSDQIKNVASKEGRVNTEVELLQSAPEKISSLKFLHDITCAPSGDQ